MSVETPPAQRLHSRPVPSRRLPPPPLLPFLSLFKGSTLSHKSSCEVTSFIMLYAGGSLADTHLDEEEVQTPSHP